jgi:putative oxidoreductase
MKILQSLTATQNSDIALLLCRLGLGVGMFPHGAQKLLGWFGGHGFAATMGAFTGGMHIPAPLAFLVIFTEFFGALAVIAGLLTRLAAAGIAAIMLVAVGMAHWPNGFFMNWSGNQKGEGFEYHLLALALALALVAAGPGKWSLDQVLARKAARRV